MDESAQRHGGHSHYCNAYFEVVAERDRLTDLVRELKRSERRRESLRQTGLTYPGGDACPAMVLRGLAKVRNWFVAQAAAEGHGLDREEAAALQWLDHRLDAGADMLPRGKL